MSAKCRLRPYPTGVFVKAFMHNGYLLSLKEVVHFYNTRDKFAFNVQSGHCPKRDGGEGDLLADP